MTNITWMADATGSSEQNIPANAPFVGGYISGLNGVEWAASQWDRFTGRKIRIYQGVGPVPALLSFDEIDVETYAVTPQQAAQIVKARVDAGITWTNIYGTDASIGAVAIAIQALGQQYWVGHVTCRLANWNLNQAEAEALVGTSIHGMTCMGVQWASDSSNPNTLIPGTQTTLKEGNVDLSVVDATFIPSYVAPAPAPPPAKVLVSVSGGFSDGSTEQLWHA